MIGNFKNAGANGDRSTVLLNDYDFRSDASGVGISYGVYARPTTAPPSASVSLGTRVSR